MFSARWAARAGAAGGGGAGGGGAAGAVALCLPWLVLLAVFSCLVAVSNHIAGVDAEAFFAGLAWRSTAFGSQQLLPAEAVDQPFNIPRWGSLDRERDGNGQAAVGATAAAAAAAATPEEMLASVSAIWGLAETGLPAAPVDARTHQRAPAQTSLSASSSVFVTVIGGSAVSELILPSYATTEIEDWQTIVVKGLPTFVNVQYRVVACGTELTNLEQTGRKSGGVDIVVVGECSVSASAAPSTTFKLFASAYAALDQLHATVRMARRIWPRAIVAYCAPRVVDLPPQAAEAAARDSNGDSFDRSWEQRKARWWGWDALNGRTSSAGRGISSSSAAAAVNRRGELFQLWAYLLIRHACLREGVPVVFQPQQPQEAFEHSPLELLLRQLEALRFSPAATSVSARNNDAPLSLLLRCAPLLLTRKYDAACLPPPQLQLPLLLTTLGGGGTHALASSLQSAGIDVLHEGVGAAGAVSWMYAVNDAAIGTVYPHHAFLPSDSRGILSPRFSRVVHVTRTPLDHVSSFTAHLSASYSFVRLAALQLTTALQWILDATKAWTRNPSRQNLARIHALAATVGNYSAPLASARGHECNLPFAAVAWLLWDALADLQADARLHVEVPREIEDLAAQLCRSRKIDCNPSDEEREAGLVRIAASSLYRGYKFLLAAARQGSTAAAVADASIRRKIHKQHREYTLADVVNLGLAPLPVHDGKVISIPDEIMARARLYNYHPNVTVAKRNK